MWDKCIFCKEDSSNSKSIEHIIPESLGNTEHILPKGVVCDKCNNYFARKIEKKVLEYSSFQLDRFHMSIPSKKGRVPSAFGLMTTSSSFSPITLYKDKDMRMSFEIREDVEIPKKGSMIIPALSYLQNKYSEGEISDDNLLTRFIAKIAFESLVYKSIVSIENIYDDTFDGIRHFIRYGDARGHIDFPMHMKTAYPADKVFYDGEIKEEYQVLHEFEFIIEKGSIYFSIVIFGIEYKIYLGVVEEQRP